MDTNVESQFMKESLLDTIRKLDKTSTHLRAIKCIVDCYFDKRLCLNNENNDLHMLDAFMGMISNHAYEGLGLNIPARY